MEELLAVAGDVRDDGDGFLSEDRVVLPLAAVEVCEVAEADAGDAADVAAAIAAYLSAPLPLNPALPDDGLPSILPIPPN
jgi:hypothetical protein